jgi:hypothetical protein
MFTAKYTTGIFLLLVILKQEECLWASNCSESRRELISLVPTLDWVDHPSIRLNQFLQIDYIWLLMVYSPFIEKKIFYLLCLFVMLALSLTNKDIYCTYKKLHVEILSKVSTM